MVRYFEQSCWLKPHFDLNTEIRANAKVSFEDFVRKRMNTKIYGKFMENTRIRRNGNFISNHINCLKEQSELGFDKLRVDCADHTIFM